MSAAKGIAASTPPAAEPKETGFDSAKTAEILSRYEPGPQASALATGDPPPSRFVKGLLAKDLPADAVVFLAYALPRREAVWWGLRCLRSIAPPEPAPEIAAALSAVDTWVNEPTDQNRRAAMPAGVQKHMNAPRFVAAQDHRLAAHARGEIIAGFGDLALVPDKQPGPREQFFQFLGEDAVIDKDFATDNAALGIDEAVGWMRRGNGHGCSFPVIGLDPRRKLGRCCDRRNVLPGFGGKMSKERWL